MHKLKGLLKGVAILTAGVFGMTLGRAYVAPIAEKLPLDNYPRVKTWLEDVLVVLSSVVALVVTSKLTGRFLGHGGPSVSAHATGGGK